LNERSLNHTKQLHTLVTIAVAVLALSICGSSAFAEKFAEQNGVQVRFDGKCLYDPTTFPGNAGNIALVGCIVNENNYDVKVDFTVEWGCQEHYSYSSGTEHPRTHSKWDLVPAYTTKAFFVDVCGQNDADRHIHSVRITSVQNRAGMPPPASPPANVQAYVPQRSRYCDSIPSDFSISRARRQLKSLNDDIQDNASLLRQISDEMPDASGNHRNHLLDERNKLTNEQNRLMSQRRFLQNDIGQYESNNCDLPAPVTAPLGTNGPPPQPTGLTPAPGALAPQDEDNRYGMYSRGISADIRFRILQILKQGKHVRDVEFNGDGVVALYGSNEHLAYNVDPRIDTTLTALEREQPQFPVRRVRTAGNGVFIVLWGWNGWRSFGLGTGLVQKLNELTAQNEEFRDIALYGPESYILVRGNNGWWANNVPQGWLDSMKQIKSNNWNIRQVMEGSGDDRQLSFVALINNNGDSWNNAPSDLVALWKKIMDQNRTIECFGMHENNWILFVRQ